MTETNNWQHAAVGKFFDLSSRATGQRADLLAKMARRAEMARDLANLQRELAVIESHVSSTPMLPGRQADRDRAIDRIDALRADIARNEALLSAATAAVDAALARNPRLETLVNGCGILLHRLGLLSRYEANL